MFFSLDFDIIIMVMYMENNLKEKEMERLLKKIDNTKLVKEEELDKMDFYELCYYMQNLNIIDTLDGDDVEEGEA